MSVPVAVVGGGPAGLVIGNMLQRSGISFVLLERHPQADLARSPKAGMIEYRTVQLLRSAGIADSILEFTVPNHRIRLACWVLRPGRHRPRAAVILAKALAEAPGCPVSILLPPAGS